MEYNGKEAKIIEIPLDRERRKYIKDEKAIKIMEDFFDNKYKVEIIESSNEESPVLRITKRI